MTAKLSLQKRSGGFTLVEVIVAASLLAIAIVPILKALTISYASSTAIEQKTCSLIYAQSKLDQIRLHSIYNYDTVYTTAGESLGSSYFCKVQDTPESADLRTITVSVGFDTNGNGILSSDEIHVALSTLIARRY